MTTFIIEIRQPNHSYPAFRDWHEQDRYVEGSIYDRAHFKSDLAEARASYEAQNVRVRRLEEDGR